MIPDNNSALVLFSGGQDSSTCVAWALTQFDRVETVGFDYGQRHRVELACRRTIRDKLRAAFPAWSARLGDDHTLDLATLGALSETALTREAEITLTADGLPSTFVPGRNLVFLTFAAALAYRRGIRHIVAGMCETDYSGYPDCRDDTIKALQVALNLGMQRRFVLAHAADVDRQGGDLQAGAGPRRTGAARPDPRGDPHLLPRRPHAPPRLGLRLRHLPGV